MRGPARTVRITPALGGAFTEWSVSTGQPAHELRMLVSSQGSDGTLRVWRFEQDPAPAIANEGHARIDGQEFVADFVTTTGPAGRYLRERWRLTAI